MQHKSTDEIVLNLHYWQVTALLDALKFAKAHCFGTSPADSLETVEKDLNYSIEEEDYRHYTDGTIELRYTDALGCGESWAVFVNNKGETRVIDTSDNFFGASDLVDAFKALASGSYDGEEEEKEALDAFKNWLVACGCDPDELED